MMEIRLAKGKGIALVDDEDYELVNQYKWTLYQRKENNLLYAYSWRFDSNGKQKSIKMHRLILNQTDPKIKVDHKDGDGLNNQKSNLRLATNAQNTQNIRTRTKGKTSKYKGVFFWKDKWVSRVTDNRKRITLGYFDTELEAVKAYNNAALECYGEFAKLNIIEEIE